MYDRIKHLFNSAISETAMLLLVCCLLTWTVSLRHYGQWNFVAICAAVAGFVILVSWIGWCIYVFAAKKDVREMPVAPRRIMEGCSGLLMICWILACGNAAFAWPWLIWFGWIAAVACLSIPKFRRG